MAPRPAVPVAREAELLARFEAALTRLGVQRGRALVAVSGGPDSLALFDLLVRVAGGRSLELVVAHFDHGIHPESGRVADAVAAAAADRGVAYLAGRAELGPGTSETVARRHRLRWLAQARERAAADWILTAHHRDDQIETVLMRALRGSGPAGLAGIAERRGRWRRPLLQFSREDLAGYLEQVRQSGWVDPANSDPAHLRSWVRHDVLPMLEQRLPGTGDRLIRLAAAARERREAWDALLDELPGLDFRAEGRGASVAAGTLAGYSSAVVRGLLSALAHRLGWSLGFRRLERVQALLRQGHSGRGLDLYRGRVAALEQGRLRLYRAVEHRSWQVALVAGEAIRVGEWEVEATMGEAPPSLERIGFTTWVAPGAALELRNWRAGDRIKPLGGTGRRLVVRCMQEEKIPRHRRPGWPVLMLDGTIVWIPGVCRGETAIPDPGTRAVRIDVREC